MNRRKFLRWLGVGAVAGAVAPVALLKKEPASVAAESDADYHRSIRAQIPEAQRSDIIGGWVSYRVRYTVTLPPNTPFRYRLGAAPVRNVTLS